MDEQNKEDAVGRNLEPETEARIWKPDQGSLIPSQRNRLEPSVCCPSSVRGSNPAPSTDRIPSIPGRRGFRPTAVGDGLPAGE
jgi:hypothetical protein